MIADDYPSMVPFWVHLQGIPLHLCTYKNLEAIGDRLGKVDPDLIDTAEGKIRVLIDSSKPMKFTKKLQTKNKEDITIKLHYEKLFKHCTECGLMTHETQECLKKLSLPMKPTARENVFDRMRPEANRNKPRASGVRGSTEAPRKNDEESLRSYSKETNSVARVQRSSHSSRLNRSSNARGSRFNPYSSSRREQTMRTPEINKERVWKEKRGENKKEGVVDTGSVSTATMAPKAVERPCYDSNVTFRQGSSSDTAKITRVNTADDLIPPYDALKIDALNYDHDQDNEEGDLADAEMEEATVGNELSTMEEDDLLGEDLENLGASRENGNGQEPSVLMIEGIKETEAIEAEETGKKIINITYNGTQ